MASTRLYCKGKLAASDFDLEQVSEHLQDPDAVVWVDFHSPSQDDLATIAKELGLHALAIEDALAKHERPKFDQYDGHSFLTAKAVRFDDDVLAPTEVSAFITERALVTVRDEFDFEDVLKRWDEPGDLSGIGVGFLLHGLLDSIVDGHLAVAQKLDDEIEDLEDVLFEERPDHKGMQRRALRLRKNLVMLRRVELPMADVVGALLRTDDNIVTDELRPYFQDVNDHVLRVTDWTESLREMTTTLRETQLTAQGNVMNMIMKKVTSWAAIIAVPTAITGFYGQNLPYPGFEQPWGFWVSTAAILALSGVLYATFKKRDWL
ncbi:MAG: magnesium transporter CorA family protein [Umezawaea sp.]